MKKYPYLSLQWHITTNCGNRCRHCYMYDSATFQQERQNTLSLKDMCKILDSLEDFENKYQVEIHHLSISGGDPLLRQDWKEFIQEVVRRKKSFAMMGNPETLTEENVKKLTQYGIRGFQMSLDGMEKTHDYFRSSGSFQRTVKKLDLLKKYNISSNIMFTLFPNNADELIPLLNFVANKTTAKSFSFDIGCYVGNASELNKNFTPIDMQKILRKFLEEKRRLKQEGTQLNIFEKTNLLKLSRFEENSLYPMIPLHGGVLSGCLVGYTPPAILSDGTLLACRKMPLSVGKMPEQTFEEIYLGNSLLKKFRRPQSFEECGKCDFYALCRGCPANVYSLTKDPFQKNPFCFRANIKKTTNEEEKIQPGPSLATTYQEEWDYLSQRFRLLRMHKFLDNKHFQQLYLKISKNSEDLQAFFHNPYQYTQEHQHILHPDQLAFIMHHFSAEKEFIEKDPILEQIHQRIYEEQMFSFF